MSGLAEFFGHELPQDATATETVTYATSLCKVVPVNTNCAHQHQPTVGSSTSAFVPIEQGEEGSSKIINGDVHELHGWASWRERQKDLVSDYMDMRIIGPDAVEGDNEVPTHNANQSTSAPTLDSHLYEEDENEDEEDPPSSNIETQPPPNVYPTAELKQPNKSFIPHHINDTIHEVQYLDQVDLYTRSLNLELCQVTKVQKLHETKPPVGMLQSPPVWHRLYSHPQFPFLDFTGMCDAGPFGVIYKNFLLMEVVQRCAFVPDLRKQALALEADVTTQPQRLRVFFYNHYAEVVQAMLHRAPRNATLFVRLCQLPACCIVPYARVNVDWFDRHDMSPYCLCVGDRSRMRLDKDLDFLRLDDTDMALNIGWEDGEAGFVEWQVFYSSNDSNRANKLDNVIRKGDIRAEKTSESGLLGEVFKDWVDIQCHKQKKTRKRQTVPIMSPGELASNPIDLWDDSKNIDTSNDVNDLVADAGVDSIIAQPPQESESLTRNNEHEFEAYNDQATYDDLQVPISEEANGRFMEAPTPVVPATLAIVDLAPQSRRHKPIDSSSSAPPRKKAKSECTYITFVSIIKNDKCMVHYRASSNCVSARRICVGPMKVMKQFRSCLAILWKLVGSTYLVWSSASVVLFAQSEVIGSCLYNLWTSLCH
jgi:hypothetical protein